jgi:hypothetical protein
MENKFISHIFKLTFCLALCAFFAMGFYQSFLEAAGILAGAGWSLANVYFLKKFLQEWLTQQPRDNWKAFIFLQIKFPILYLIGYVLLRLKLFPTFTLVIGFSLIFLAILLFGLQKIFLDKFRAKVES